MSYLAERTGAVEKKRQRDGTPIPRAHIYEYRIYATVGGVRGVYAGKTWASNKAEAVKLWREQGGEGR
jgi:hypothetical protein